MSYVYFITVIICVRYFQEDLNAIKMHDEFENTEGQYRRMIENGRHDNFLNQVAENTTAFDNTASNHN